MSSPSISYTQTSQVLGTTPRSPSTLDRMVLWTQAYDLWLDSRRSPNTRRAYRLAWESFLDSTSKLPWDVGKSDIALWVEQLLDQTFIVGSGP
jgi:hypothetical protein